MRRLHEISQLEQIAQDSIQKPQLIFKHSTRCSISAAAKHRLESDLTRLKSHMEIHFLDLLLFRDVSNAVSERFGVHHESPQIILVHNGRSVLDLSHYDIMPGAIVDVVRQDQTQGAPN